MRYHRQSPTHQLPALIILVLILSVTAACRGKPAPAPGTPTPGLMVEAPRPTRTPLPTATPVSAPAGDQFDLSDGIPAEPFRYEIKLQPMDQTGAAGTDVRGIYKAGDWQQTAGGSSADVAPADSAQESIVAGGAAYIRSAGQTDWARWPAPSFEDAYGLTSPFTPLRLHALAGIGQGKERGRLSLTPGAPEATFSQTVTFSGEAVASLLNAGAAASGVNGADNLSAQIAPMAISQTVTFWTGESGRLYRAEALLRTRNEAGQVTPWLAAAWRYWDYGDGQIKISAPGAPAGGQTAAGAPVNPTPVSAADADLTVRVFASPGVPAADFAVTIYRADDAQRQPMAWYDDSDVTADAVRFALPPGAYDVRVQAAYAESWLRGVEIAAGQPAITKDVAFDFGTLQLAVTHDGAPIAANEITYPAGDRANWVDERAGTAASIPLRAGIYDVEIGYDTPPISTTVTGITIQAGETVSRTVTVK
jgi:hypothetical protein